MFGLKRGPDAVLASLERGLLEIGVPYKLNGKIAKTDTVHVLSGIEALEEMIYLKKIGRINKLIAGPNIVVLPTEQESLLADSSVDKIITNSIWTRDLYASLIPERKKDIIIWAAGVIVPSEHVTPIQSREYCLVFKKNTDESLYQYVVDSLKEKEIPFKQVTYGQYDQKEYFDLLSKASCMIYLQEVESQGLALQEAWVRDVPTLVWNKGSFTYPKGPTVTGNIAAPYLTDACGELFGGKEDFLDKLAYILKNISNYTPRNYTIQYLSDKISAENYVKLLELS